MSTALGPITCLHGDSGVICEIVTGHYHKEVGNLPLITVANMCQQIILGSKHCICSHIFAYVSIQISFT